MYDMFGLAQEKQAAKTGLNLDPTFNYLLFFGFIRKYKGLGLLLDSFSRFDYKKYKVKLIIAGEFYEDAAPYLAQIKELGLFPYRTILTLVVLLEDYIFIFWLHLLNLKEV